ncbi:MAG: integrin alpha [Acidobacteriota bacterium]
MSRSRLSAVCSPAAALLAAVFLQGGSAVLADPLRHPSSDWVSSIESSLAAREYQASATTLGLQAPNRAQGFRTYFEADGLRVVDRTAREQPELLRVRLIKVELDGVRLDSAAVTGWDGSAPIAPAANAAQVETSRGRVTELSVNGPEGLRFGVRVPIAGLVGAPGRLVIEWKISGPSLGRFETDAAGWDRLPLTTASGRRLELGRLPVVKEGSQVPLLSRWRATERGRVRLVIELGASVPEQLAIVAQLILTGAADDILESNQVNAFLGESVAGAGDVNGDGYADVIVGAPGYDLGTLNEGAAFIFLGSAAGIASGNPAGASTTLQSNQSDAQLGSSVAAAGDVNGDGYGDVIVGARLYDAGQTDEGAAFVFLGSATGVAAGDPSNASATLQSNQAGAFLGASVAGAGDVNGDGYQDVIVGAHHYELGEPNEGAAFVFLGGAAGVASGNPSTAAATLQSNQVGAEMGGSVAGAGDVNGDGYADVIVGSPYQSLGEVSEGAAFVFLGSASGVAAGNPSNAAATLQSNQADANLGTSVAAAGDVNGDGYGDVIVGASGYDSGQVNEGSAFLFLGGSGSGVASGNPSSAAAELESNQAGARLGTGVAGVGDVNGDGYADVVVGAPFYDLGDDEGAAFLFLGSAAGVPSGNPSSSAATLHVNLAAGQTNGQLGSSVAGAGDINGDGYGDVIVGAPKDGFGQTWEGAAFLFLGGARGVVAGSPTSSAANLQLNQASAQLGFSVAAAGDVNGDGYGDVIVGAPLWDAGLADEGRAFIYHGSSAGLTFVTTSLGSSQAGARFGSSASAAGDVNGDGYGDVIVGAFLYDSAAADSGAAFIFLGSSVGVPSGTVASAATVLQSARPSAQFGYSVAGAGDVNGDGYGDVIVGADQYDLGESNEGTAYVFLGSPSGVAPGGPSTAATTLQSNQPDALFGWSVAGAGDVNGDGYADVIVGAIQYDQGQTNEGAAFVFLGSPFGVASGGALSASATLQSNQASSFLGWSVASAGDVNGDGYADVLVGAPFYDLGQADEGAAFVFLGGAGGVGAGNPANAATTLQSFQADAQFGWSVSGAGDVNGDGYGDVIVGAPAYDSGQSGEGAAFVFLGEPSGVATSSPGLESNQAGARLGASVAGIGDVNGDGFGDVAVGAPLYDSGQTDEGAVFAFAGGGGGNARQVRMQQLRAGTSIPVAPWGSSRDAKAFKVKMSVTTPAGGGRVRTEVEACLAGKSFGDPSCARRLSPAWGNLTGSPTGAQETAVSSLTAARLYHWRARVLYQPASVLAAGIIVPPHPPHGPWRRFQAQVSAADVRTESGVFYALTPCRLVDTRGGSPVPPIGGPILTSGSQRTLTLAGKCSIPLTARAVSLNITAVDPLGRGELVIYPISGQPTDTSAVSFAANRTRANNAVFGLNLSGQIQVLPWVSNPSGPDQVHLVVDVNGYFE